MLTHVSGSPPGALAPGWQTRSVPPPLDVPVIDLSAGGCLVELGFRGFKEGERVLVHLPGLSAIPGEVVWIEEKDAGIAFEAVLHDAVLEHLMAARQS